MTLFDKSYSIDTTVEKNFQDAWATCTARGGKLPSLDSDQNIAVLALFASK